MLLLIPSIFVRLEDFESFPSPSIAKTLPNMYTFRIGVVVGFFFCSHSLSISVLSSKLKSIDQTVIDLWCMANKING